jgi:S1-C subfamily serine protease
VAPLDAEVARELNYPEARGVVIRRVSPAGPAARRNIGAGLRIDEINRQPVETVSDVERLLEDVEPGDVVSLRVSSPDGSSRVVNLRVPG